MDRQRRRIIIAAGSLLAAAPTIATAALLTPRQSAGPFYPVDLPLDDDNDLIHVAGESVAAVDPSLSP